MNENRTKPKKTISAENSPASGVTKEKVLELLDPAVFRAWLVSKPAKEPVGYNDEELPSTLSEFFREQGISANFDPDVFIDSLIVPGLDFITLPVWAQQFREDVYHGECSQLFPISPEEAKKHEQQNTTSCKEGAAHAQKAKGGWFQYALFRPVAGECIALLDVILKEIEKEDESDDDWESTWTEINGHKFVHEGVTWLMEYADQTKSDSKAKRVGVYIAVENDPKKGIGLYYFPEDNPFQHAEEFIRSGATELPVETFW